MPLALLFALAAPLAYFARLVAPLAGYDTPEYASVYWLLVVTASAAFLVAACFLIGISRLRAASVPLIKALAWPSAASQWQFVVAVAFVTAAVATLPRYTWLTRVGSGGTAPFSKVETDLLAFVWRPVLDRTPGPTSIGPMIAIIAVSWASVGAAAALLLWLLLRRRPPVSVIGTIILTALVSYAALRLLRAISPLTLPF